MWWLPALFEGKEMSGAGLFYHVLERTAAV
jgi:hypothetical protein